MVMDTNTSKNNNSVKNINTEISDLIKKISKLSDQYEDNVTQFSKVNDLYRASSKSKEEFDLLLEKYETQINKNIEELNKRSEEIKKIRKNIKETQTEIQSLEDNVSILKKHISEVKTLKNKEAKLKEEFNDLADLSLSTTEKYNTLSIKISKLINSDFYEVISNNNEQVIMDRILNYIVDNIEIRTDKLFRYKIVKKTK